jgi:AraC-like DNA-binding protein
MRVSIPEYINNLDPSTYKKVSVDDMTLLEYRHAQNNNNSEILLTKNMLILPLKGRKIIKFPETECLIQKGDICFIKKGNFIATEKFFEEEGCYEALLIFVSDEFIKGFIDDYFDLFEKGRNHAEYYGHHIFSLSPFIKATIESIFPILAFEHRHAENILKLKLYELFINLIQTDGSSIFKDLLNQIAEETEGHLINIMEANFTKPYKLEEFAKMTFRSLSKFKKDFKGVFGMPPKEWINSKRLERARLLLLNKNYDVTEVSFLVGFENYSHFIQLFKKKYNCTPKQYSINYHEKTPAEVQQLKTKINI